MKNFPDKELLTWFAQNPQDLPWRVLAPNRPNPWHVLVSEIMLQQTTIQTIAKRFSPFIAQFPNPQTMAKAPLNEVLDAWAGLGYYRRAHLLHRASQEICTIHQGIIPHEYHKLRALSGLGDYTAAAVASLAFHQPHLPIDANIARIGARYFAIKTESQTKLHQAIHHNMREIIAKQQENIGDFVQALMAATREFCGIKRTNCQTCPLQPSCLGQENPSQYPNIAIKKIRPHHNGLVVVLRDDFGNYILRRRREKAMLGGMLEFPSSNWHENLPISAQEFCESLASIFDYSTNHKIRHNFTHFSVELTIIHATISRDLRIDEIAIPADKLPSCALPTLMKKIRDAIL